MFVADMVDETVKKIIDELNEMTEIYKYNSNDAGIKGNLYITNSAQWLLSCKENLLLDKQLIILNR
jgi:hypothetical protein